MKPRLDPIRVYDDQSAHVLPADEFGQHAYHSQCACNPIVQNGVTCHFGFVIKRRAWVCSTVYERPGQ